MDQVTALHGKSISASVRSPHARSSHRLSSVASHHGADLGLLLPRRNVDFRSHRRIYRDPQTGHAEVGSLANSRRNGGGILYFGAGLSAQTIYNDIDKTMLARMSTLDATGIYGAAYRLVDVAFLPPVRSVLNAAYTNFFRHGQQGIATKIYSYAKKLLPKMVGYSLLAFAGLFIAAPIIPIVLGGEYSRTVEALRWLAVLPLLKTVHYFFADALTRRWSSRFTHRLPGCSRRP